MKILSKIYCFIHGHDFIKAYSDMDNGRSKWGQNECMRCGKKHDWQYDYN